MAQEVSYSQYLLWNDVQFQGRIGSVLKSEGFIPVGQHPQQAAYLYAPDVANEPGLAEAYHAALIADPPIEQPGASNEVIPDGMLLSAVTAVHDAMEALPGPASNRSV